MSEEKSSLPAVSKPLTPATLPEILESQRHELERALQNQIPADYFIRVAQTCMRKNPLLFSCTKGSILESLMDCAQLGLALESHTGEAYLVPFKEHNKRTGGFEYRCKLMVGYRGYVKMMRRSKNVKSVYAGVVYKGDHFVCMHGTNGRMEHQECLEQGGKRGTPLGAIAYVSYLDGGEDFLFSDADYIERCRRVSKNPEAPMWTTFWEEGWKKTSLRHMSKTVDLSPEVREALERELDLDGAIDVPTTVTTEEPSQLAANAEERAKAEEPVQQQTKNRGWPKGKPRKPADAPSPPPPPEPMPFAETPSRGEEEQQDDISYGPDEQGELLQ